MKKIHKLLFIFIIFSVLLVPSYSVKADIGSIFAADTEEMMKKIVEEVGGIDALKQFVEETKKQRQELEEKIKKEQQDLEGKKDCIYIFGDPKKESSLAYIMQKILNYVKILAPLLVVLLSGFDFAKNTLTGDQDEMKKATKKLGIRIICAVGIYLAPLLTGFLINFINNSSVDPTCNIK